MPIFSKLDSVPDSLQMWYADDFRATGKLAKLWQRWDQISQSGPKYGYFL